MEDTVILQQKREKRATKKKKTANLDKVTDINSSFDVMEDVLNGLLKIVGASIIDKAAYQKLAEAKMKTKSFKSPEEKKIWEIRQVLFFRGAAVQSALKQLDEELYKKDRKARKMVELAQLLDAIPIHVKNVRKHTKTSFSQRDKELNSTQEILEEKEKKLASQLALGIKAGLKDDETAKKMKALAAIQEEAIQSNRLAIESLEELKDAVMALDGAAGLVHLALSYYRRYSRQLTIAGFAIGGVFLLLISAVVVKKVSPIFTKTKKVAAKVEVMVEETRAEKTENQTLDEEEQPKQPKKKELTPDEKFRVDMLNAKPFVPDCGNNFIVFAGDDLGEASAFKEASHFLSARRYKVEGEGAVQIIRVRNETELEAALRNGALNSPYCINGKLFSIKRLGYDLGRFPVYLKEGLDPNGFDAGFIIKEQLDYAKKRIGTGWVRLLPKIYRGKGDKGTSKNEGYRKAVREYLENYRRARKESAGNS